MGPRFYFLIVWVISDDGTKVNLIWDSPTYMLTCSQQCRTTYNVQTYKGHLHKAILHNLIQIK